jgi:hypothetical protein
MPEMAPVSAVCDARPVADSSDDPQDWRLDIPMDRIDLYRELADRPRALTADEARMMVELVDAWRALEHRKHIALEHAREEHAGG